YKRPGSPFPALAGVTTLNHLRGVDQWELSACWSTAQRMGWKFTTAIKSAGVRPRQKATKMPNMTAMARVKKSDRAKDRTDLRAGLRVRGDEVVYDRRLPGIVDRMKMALVDGWVLHARVISGTYLDQAGAGTPYEEHSLLLLDVRGDEFLAFDPDASSNLAA